MRRAGTAGSSEGCVSAHGVMCSCVREPCVMAAVRHVQMSLSPLLLSSLPQAFPFDRQTYPPTPRQQQQQGRRRRRPSQGDSGEDEDEKVSAAPLPVWRCCLIASVVTSLCRFLASVSVLTKQH